MDLKELKEILQILEEKEITEFELEEEGMKLRIRKAGPSPTNHAVPSGALAAALPFVAHSAASRAHSSPLSTTRLTSPIRSAAAASIRSPKKSSSDACARPTSRGSR